MSLVEAFPFLYDPNCLDDKPVYYDPPTPDNDNAQSLYAIGRIILWGMVVLMTYLAIKTLLGLFGVTLP